MYDDLALFLMNSLKSTNQLVNCVGGGDNAIECLVKEGLMNVIKSCSMEGCENIGYEQGPLFAEKILPLAAIGGLSLVLSGLATYRLHQRMEARIQAERVKQEQEASPVDTLAKAIVNSLN